MRSDLGYSISLKEKKKIVNNFQEDWFEFAIKKDENFAVRNLCCFKRG